MFPSKIKLAYLGSAATLLLGIDQVAYAQQVEGAAPVTKQEDALDIVVTAERREGTLLNTPMAVSALNSEDLSKHGFQRTNDLAGLAAGLTVPNQNYANQTFFIRGVGSTIASGNPMVGFYIDDVYIARPFGIGWYGSLPDIERIEIIRGPQGTLYGQNSAAGAIKLVSILPKDEFKGWAEVSAGNLGAFGGRAYVSGALVPGILTGSLAYAHLENSGPDYNPIRGRKQGGLHNDQFRGILRYTPDPKLEIVARADVLRDRSEYRTTAPATAPAGYVTGPRTTFSEIDPVQTFDNYGGTLHVTYKINDNLSVKNISAVRVLKNWSPTDSDGLPTYISGFTRRIKSQTYSNETQLQGEYGDLSFTLGAVWFREILDQYRFSWNNNVFNGQNSHNFAEDLGIYGHAKYKVTDRLTATLGVRVNREVKSMDSYAYRSNLLGATTSLQKIAEAAGTVVSNSYNVSGLSQTYWATTPKIGLDFKITPDVLVYANWSSGQGSGGYNQAAGSINVATIPVDPAKVSAFEAGLKVNALQGRLFATLTGFYNDFKDYQATVSNPIYNGQVQTGTIQVNAGDAHIYGGEFELRAKPIRNLETFAAVTILRDAFDSYQNPTGAATTNYVGQELPFVPKTSLGFGAAYTIPFANGSHARLFGSARHESSSFSEITTYRADTKFPRQTYVDANASYTFAGERWTVSVNAKNLLNKTYMLPLAGGYSPANNLYGRLANWPRQVTFTVRQEF